MKHHLNKRFRKLLINLGLRQPIKVATPISQTLSDDWSAQQKLHNERMLKLNEFILNNSH